MIVALRQDGLVEGIQGVTPGGYSSFHICILIKCLPYSV